MITKGGHLKFKSLLVTIGLITPLVMLGLVSCGGGNDVASSGATAVSATAPAPEANTASLPSTTTTATISTSTEPKINGQIDERTGVAPIVALAAIPGENCSYNGVTNVQAQYPCSYKNCLARDNEMFPLCEKEIESLSITAKNVNLLTFNLMLNKARCSFIGGGWGGGVAGSLPFAGTVAKNTCRIF